MNLYQPTISGSLEVSGSVTINGTLRVLSGSILGTASIAENSLLLGGLNSGSFQSTSSFSSFSGSLSTRLVADEANIATNTAASASFAAQSASLSTRLTTDESNFTSLSSSFVTTSGSVAGRVTLIEGQYATTGSNNFTKPQQISDVSNAISFTSTASLYTDGGLRVKGSSFVSGTAYFNDVVVYGTSSIEYITSSQLAIGTNIITLNTDTPSIRFGGISVFDSGSNNLSTGSLFWDSEKDKWIYSNPSASTYDGGMLISGPRNSSGLGNEVGTTSCALMMGQGGDHITSSAIFSYGNATCFYNGALIVSSSCSIGIGTAPGGIFDVKTGACSNVLFTGDCANVSAINSYSTTNGFQTLKYAAGTHMFYAGATGGGVVSEAVRITCCGTMVVGYNKAGTADLLQRTITLGGRPDNGGVVSLGFDAGCTYRADFDFSGVTGKFEFWNYSGSWGSSPKLAIDINGIACFASRICSPSSTTANLRVSDETTYGLSVCKGLGGYPILQADNGQSIGFYTGEGGGTSAERIKIWQTGIVTIGCQVCLIQLTVSNAGGASYNIANYLNTNSTTNSQTFFFVGQSLTNGRSGFMDWVDNTDCSNGYVAFGVYGDNPASGAGNGLMIKRGACVGINNNNPLRHLHVGPGSDSPINPNNGVYISNNGTTALAIRDSTNDSEFTTQVQSSGTILGTLTNHDLIVYTCNTERMRIANNGVTALCINSALVMAKGTVAQRPTAVSGMLRYNSDYNLMEFYNGTSWVQMGSGDLATGYCFNNTSMCHSVYQAPGTLGLIGQGSPCITVYGAATPSMGVYVGNNYFSTHGGHCGISDYPGYWAVNLGAPKAVNQLQVWIHANSWGYFELQGSNNSGNAPGFNQSGTWTNLSFLCSNSNNCQNMGGNASGCADGTVFTFWYTNNVPFQAYRIKVLDSSRPTQALGTTYAGSAGYVWVLNRV